MTILIISSVIGFIVYFQPDWPALRGQVEQVTALLEVVKARVK